MDDTEAPTSPSAELALTEGSLTAEIVTVGEDAGQPGRRAVRERTARKIEESFSPNTLRAWRSRWRLWEDWCAVQDPPERPLPADPAAVADYLSALGDLGHTASTMEAHLGTIGSRHRRELGVALDTSAARRIVVQRAREQAADPDEPPNATLQATALTPAHVARAVSHLDLGTTRGLQERAVLVLALALGARRSEVAALALNDIEALPYAEPHPEDGIPVLRTGLRVTIRRSKTDQRARGAVVWVRAGRRARDSSPGPTCPVAAVLAWRDHLRLEHAITSGPLFRRIDRWGNLARPGQRVAGRRPDPATGAHRADDGGISDRTVANIIQRATAVLARELAGGSGEFALPPAPAAPRSKAGSQGTNSAADREQARRARAPERRRHRRELANKPARFTGHSPRRGHIDTALTAGQDPYLVARRTRFADGSKHFWRYVDRAKGFDSGEASRGLGL